MTKYLFILSILLSFCIHAQYYQVKHYTTDDGLVSNEVHDLLQDNQKVLWILNGKGISAYDGKKFKNFVHIMDLSPSSNIIQINNNLKYSYTYGSVKCNYLKLGVTTFDRNILFTYIPEVGASKQSRFYLDKDGYSIFYKTHEESLTDTLYCYNNSNKLLRLPFRLDNTKRFNALPIIDNQNNLWIILSYVDKHASKKIALYNFDKEKIVPVIKDINLKYADGIFTSSKGLIYVITENKLVLIKNGKIKDSIAVNYGYRSSYSLKLKEDKQGIIWGGYYKGLIKISGSKIQYIENTKRNIISAKEVEYDYEGKQHIRDVYNDAIYINCLTVNKDGTVITGNETYDGKAFFEIDIKAKNSIQKVFTDEENQIWFATLDGLFVAKKIEVTKSQLNGSISFVSLNGSTIITAKSYLNEDASVYIYNNLKLTDSLHFHPANTWEIAKMFELKNKIIVECNEKLLVLDNNKLKELKFNIPKNKTPVYSSLNKNPVGEIKALTFYCDQEKFLWGITGQRGLIFRTDGDSFLYYGKEDGLSDTIQSAALFDKTCNYIFSTGGIHKYSNHKFSFVKNSKIPLKDYSLTMIGSQEDCSYFFAKVFDKIKTFKFFRIKNNTLEELKTNKKDSISFSSSYSFMSYGKYYIADGDHNSGYCRIAFNPNSDSVTSRDLVCSPIYRYRYPKFNFINNKLFVFGDPLQIFSIKNTNIDTLPEPVLIKDVSGFNMNSSYLDSSDNLYITDDKNLSFKINSKLDFTSKYLPETFFLKISFNTNGKQTEIDSSLKNIILPYDFNPLKIEYKAVCLTDGKKLKYRYKMNGLDDKWNEVTEDNLLYSTLPDGTYTLEIQACNNDGIWNTNSSYLVIDILPPWNRTWWAYCMYAVAGFAAIRGYLKNRTKKLEKEKQKLEKVVEERTAEVVAQKHLIEEKNKEVMDSITYAQRIQRSLMPTEKYISRILGKKK